MFGLFFCFFPPICLDYTPRWETGNPSHRGWFGFPNPPKWRACVSSTGQHMRTAQTHAIRRCPGLTVWTGDILSLITCSQHNTAQQTSRAISFFSHLLPSSCPPPFSSAPSLSFFFSLFHSVWDWGWRGRGRAVNRGRREKQRLARANNPPPPIVRFQHVRLHISKLKRSARKRGAYKILNVLRLGPPRAHYTPPSSALLGMEGGGWPTEYCGICSAAVN